MHTIIDVCAGTGAWSDPYRKAGYNVIRIDLPQDARLLKFLPTLQVHGVLCAPPCTVFAKAGNRWKRSDEEMVGGLSVVDACFRIIHLYKPDWWAMENPGGKLPDYLGEPQFKFHPCDFGDPYTKLTYLWGQFKAPIKKPVKPTLGSLMNDVGESKNRQRFRSKTPAGFARAFFEANP